MNFFLWHTVIYHVAFSILPMILRWLSVYVKGTKQVSVALWALFVNYKFKLKFTVCSLNMLQFFYSCNSVLLLILWVMIARNPKPLSIKLWRNLSHTICVTDIDGTSNCGTEDRHAITFLNDIIRQFFP